MGKIAASAFQIDKIDQKIVIPEYVRESWAVAKGTGNYSRLWYYHHLAKTYAGHLHFEKSTMHDYNMADAVKPKRFREWLQSVWSSELS